MMTGPIGVRSLRVMRCVVVSAISLVFLGSVGVAQQTFLRGQSVQAVFEGWEANPDGTFDLYFGYLNRNYEEQPHIPVGVNNAFAPGPADRGQPAHFYPRRQQFVFKVTVPADWGKKDLVWTITYGGKTTRAFGTLQPGWTLDGGVWQANRGSGLEGNPTALKNTPPSIKVIGETAVVASTTTPLVLTVEASDDGKLGPKPQSAPGVARSETDRSSVTNLPSSAGTSPPVQDVVKVSAARVTGLAVTWLHYRGPGTVTFDPMVTHVTPNGKALAGQVLTKVTFSQPGTFVLRAVADDGMYTRPADVTVVVSDPSSAP